MKRVAILISGGGSNMVSLVGVPIPEPSAAMLLALGGLAFLQRRR